MCSFDSACSCLRDRKLQPSFGLPLRLAARNPSQVKYYKGLGTSSAAEAKAYFSELDKHRATFTWGDEAAAAAESATFAATSGKEQKERNEGKDEGEGKEESEENDLPALPMVLSQPKRVGAKRRATVTSVPTGEALKGSSSLGHWEAARRSRCPHLLLKIASALVCPLLLAHCPVDPSRPCMHSYSSSIHRCRCPYIILRTPFFFSLGRPHRPRVQQEARGGAETVAGRKREPGAHRTRPIDGEGDWR